ncbi:MAG: hypothetical protein WCK42_03775 [Myxococcaceae bacterium]
MSTSFAGFNASDRFGLLIWTTEVGSARILCELIELQVPFGGDITESDIVFCYGHFSNFKGNLAEQIITFKTKHGEYEREIISLREVAESNTWVGLLDKKVPIYPALLKDMSSSLLIQNQGVFVFTKGLMTDRLDEKSLLEQTNMGLKFLFCQNFYLNFKHIKELEDSQFIQILEKKERVVTFAFYDVEKDRYWSDEIISEFCSGWESFSNSITNERGVILSLSLEFGSGEEGSCLGIMAKFLPDSDYQEKIKEQIRLLKQVDKNTVIAERVQKRDQILRWNGLKEYSSNYEYFSDWEEYLQYTTTYRYLVPLTLGAWLLGPTLYRRLFKPTPQVSMAEVIKRELAKQKPESQGLLVEAIKSLGKRALRHMWTEVPDATESALVNAEPQTINKDIRKKFKQDLESNTEQLEASLNQAQKKASKTYLDQLKNLKGKISKTQTQGDLQELQKRAQDIIDRIENIKNNRKGTTAHTHQAPSQTAKPQGRAAQATGFEVSSRVEGDLKGFEGPALEQINSKIEDLRTGAFMTTTVITDTNGLLEEAYAGANRIYFSWTSTGIKILGVSDKDGQEKMIQLLKKWL